MTPSEPLSATVVADRLAAVRARIEAAGGDPDRVKVVAVTKGFGSDAVAAALDAGCTLIGESYAQEAIVKLPAVPDVRDRAEVHFVGRLQTNKVRLLVPFVDVWQSVDRPRLVAELARRAPGATVMVQLNLSGEEHKGGCALDDAPALVAAARDTGLQVRGLMGVGAEGDEARTAAGFEALVALADELDLEERSIGMTSDLAAAIEAGSTMVRVGTALFGARVG